MTREPCGTLAAETRHRLNGTWPCQACEAVRAALAELSSQRGEIRDVLVDLRKRLSWWSDAERLDACRAAWQATRDLDQFSAVTGVDPERAEVFVRWLFGVLPERSAA